MQRLINLFRRNKEKSKNTAKERLRLVIVHDRGNETFSLLQKLRGELFDVLSKYMEIEDDELDIRLTEIKSETDGGMASALVANIPIKKLKIN